MFFCKLQFVAPFEILFVGDGFPVPYNGMMEQIVKLNFAYSVELWYNLFINPTNRRHIMPATILCRNDQKAEIQTFLQTAFTTPQEMTIPEWNRVVSVIPLELWLSRRSTLEVSGALRQTLVPP